MSSTNSDGRQMRVPKAVTTMGRSIRIGCATMASISASSLRAGLSSASSSYGVPLRRNMARTGRPN